MIGFIVTSLKFRSITTLKNQLLATLLTGSHADLFDSPIHLVTTPSSSSSLYCDRSTASSKLSSPKCAILSFLLQLPVSSCFLKVIQQLLTSPSSPSWPSNLSFNEDFFRKQFLRNMCPIQLAFLHLIRLQFVIHYYTHTQ
jgi:hypothetical protein